jgi:hypothetical protein
MHPEIGFKIEVKWSPLIKTTLIIIYNEMYL